MEFTDADLEAGLRSAMTDPYEVNHGVQDCALRDGAQQDTHEGWHRQTGKNICEIL